MENSVQTFITILIRSLTLVTTAAMLYFTWCMVNGFLHDRISQWKKGLWGYAGACAVMLLCEILLLIIGESIFLEIVILGIVLIAGLVWLLTQIDFEESNQLCVFIADKSVLMYATIGCIDGQPVIVIKKYRKKSKGATITLIITKTYLSHHIGQTLKITENGKTIHEEIITFDDSILIINV